MGTIRSSEQYGFGLIPTEPEVHPFGLFGGATTDGPDADRHLETFIRRGGNQNPTSTCVWWAIAQALWIILGYEKLPKQWISILAGYYYTRMRTHKDRNKIVDFGCRPPDAAMLLRELGIVPEHFWPFIAVMVDDEPTYDVAVCSDPDWFFLKRIIVPEGERGKAIRHIIHDLHRPVLIGQEVTSDYLSWRPGHPPWTFALGGKAEGRHMECIATYNRLGPLTISSWGDMFERQMAWKTVENDHVSDLWYAEIDRPKLVKMLQAA
jgi:hypothetical protein